MTRFIVQGLKPVRGSKGEILKLVIRRPVLEYQRQVALAVTCLV